MSSCIQGRVVDENSPPALTIDAHVNALELNLQVRRFARLPRVTCSSWFCQGRHEHPCARVHAPGPAIPPPSSGVPLHQVVRTFCQVSALSTRHQDSAQPVEVRHRLCAPRPSPKARQHVSLRAPSRSRLCGACVLTQRRHWCSGRQPLPCARVVNFGMCTRTLRSCEWRAVYCCSRPFRCRP